MPQLNLSQYKGGNAKELTIEDTVNAMSNAELVGKGKELGVDQNFLEAITKGIKVEVKKGKKEKIKFNTKPYNPHYLRTLRARVIRELGGKTYKKKKNQKSKNVTE